MSTIKRRGAGQFANVFGSPPTPIRRPEEDETPTDPGADVVTPTPASAPGGEPSSAAPVQSRRRAVPKPTTAPATPAGLDPATRRTLDVEARRYLAARRKLDERVRDLIAAVRAATEADPDDGEIAAILTSAGLTRRELPTDVADQLAE